LVKDLQASLEKQKEHADKIEPWLRDELKRQLDTIAEIHESSRDLETFSRAETVRLRQFLTVDSSPEALSWSAPVPNVAGPITGRRRPLYDAATAFTQFWVQDPRRFTRGQILRIQPRVGGQPEFRRITGVQRFGADPLAPDYGIVHVWPQVDGEYA